MPFYSKVRKVKSTNHVSAAITLLPRNSRPRRRRGRASVRLLCRKGAGTPWYRRRINTGGQRGKANECQRCEIAMPGTGLTRPTTAPLYGKWTADVCTATAGSSVRPGIHARTNKSTCRNNGQSRTSLLALGNRHGHFTPRNSVLSRNERLMDSGMAE